MLGGEEIVMITLQQIEQRLLWQSAGLMGLVAVSATLIGIFSNSQAILLDGIFSFVAVLIKFMMLATSKLISKETSRRFQFGYWQFEPLVLIVEGSFTLIVVVYAFALAIISLMNGGHDMDFGLAIYYALFFTVAETLYFYYVRRVNKKLKSNLIHFDNISWSIDAMLTGSILCSFVIAYFVKQTEWAVYTRYVDPLIILFLSIQMTPSALKILIPSVKQIMGVAPQELHEQVQSVMDEFMVRYQFRDYVSSVLQYGNMKTIEIDILLSKTHFIQTVQQADKIRAEIDEALGGKTNEKWLTITFTTARKWMAKDYELEDEED